MSSSTQCGRPSGFFVGMAVNCRRGRIPLLILGVSIPAILHGLND